MEHYIATVTLESITPYSQSRHHDEPKNKGELPDAYDKRTWRFKQLIKDGRVHMDAGGIHQCLAAAAKYSKKKIVGQGNATWTAKFQSGVTIFDDIDLGIEADKTDFIDIFANADGVRGSGKRVNRRFPIIPQWKAAFDIHVLDPIITEDVFTEMMEIAGMFIGIGRFRPENGGRNGRFKMTKLIWKKAE